MIKTRMRDKIAPLRRTGPKKKYPATFDITLTNAMVELSLTPENIVDLKKAADNMGIAWAAFGNEIYLRKHQIKALFPDGQ